MESDPKNPPLSNDPQTGNVPPRLPASEPPIIGAAPPLPIEPTDQSASMRQLLAILLSLFVALFLADAVVSLLDDTLIVLFNLHVLSVIRGLVFLLAMLLALVIYILMGLTPKVPKRVFLPLTLFNPAAQLAVIPLAIYFFDRIQLVSWGMSFCQVVFGFGILFWVQGRFKFHWPLLSEDWLEGRRFSWRNLLGFVLGNVFVVLPSALLFFAFSVALAINHFSGGFLTLHPDGLTVQVRKYVNDDGKTVELVPMSHIADPKFYAEISQSFPTNSVILMEGVTDDQNLLTNKINYHHAAASLGLAEQQKVFEPPGEIVPADVDVDQFSANTIDLLNLVMLIHSRGLNADTLRQLMQYTPPPHFQEQLYDDLVTKRNQHLLGELHEWLPQSDDIIVPWGAGHIPGIAKAIQKSGFHLVESRKYYVIRFHHGGNENQPGGNERTN